MGKILCFGELLLRLSPAANGQWLKNHQMAVFTGGAELNVATALAKWDLPVSYCTSLPDNYLSHDILNVVHEKNILTDSVIFSGSRIGTYYLSQGDDLKNHSVIYDRAYSAFWELKAGMIDWDHIFNEVSWFHFSAISPALNDRVASVCLEALKAASKRNITISIDLNHRPKLWGQRNPHHVMSLLMPYCDVVMGNIWSAHDLIGIPLESTDMSSNDTAFYLRQGRETANGILKRFARVKTVACTFRFEKGDNGIEYYGSLYTMHHWVYSRVYRSNKIVDKVGSGDCFMAGLIYGLYNMYKEEDIIQFAAAAGFGKLFETGDATNQDIKSIQSRISEHA